MAYGRSGFGSNRSLIAVADRLDRVLGYKPETGGRWQPTGLHPEIRTRSAGDMQPPSHGSRQNGWATYSGNAPNSQKPTAGVGPVFFPFHPKPISAAKSGDGMGLAGNASMIHSA